MMKKILRGHSNVGVKSSVAESVTTKVAITMGVGENNGEKWMTLELEIFSLNA